MNVIIVTQAKVLSNNAVCFMARIVDEVGEVITQSYVDGIACNVFDSESETLITTMTVPTDAIYDSVQKNAAWTFDSIGFNFSYVLNGTNFPKGGTTYRVEFEFAGVYIDAFYVVYELQTTKVLTVEG